MGHERTGYDGGEQAAHRARPRLAGGDTRRQAGTADPAADQVSADIAGPDDEQQEQHVGATCDGVVTQPKQRRCREHDVGQTGEKQRRPARSATQAQPLHGQADYRRGDDDGEDDASHPDADKGDRRQHQR